MRVGLNVAVIAALSLASLVRLPGLVEGIPTGSFSVGIRRASFGIGALGLNPVVSAFLVIEYVALLVPSLRGARLGGPVGRARLGRAAIVLSAALAFFQGFGIATFLEGQGWLQVPGWPARLLICVTLSGFTMMILLGLSMMDRWGLGAAFSIWLLWRAIADAALVASAPRAPDVLPFQWSQEAFLVMLKLALVAVVAGWMLRSIARPADADGRSSLALPFLASGMAPVGFVTGLLALPFALKALVPGLGDLLRWVPDLRHRTALEVGLVALTTIVFARLFQAPRRVARVIARAEALKRRSRVDLALIDAQVRPLVRRTMAKSVLFIVLVELLLLTPPRASWPWFDAAWLWLIIGPAVSLDLFDEWRARSRHPDLVSIWPEHRAYAAHTARTILEQAKIFVLLRGIHHRTCLQFFGPYVPIDIMVPAAYAEQAVGLLNGVLDERYSTTPGVHLM